MTVTDLPRPVAAGPVETPQSQDLASLTAMLDDPTLAGFHDDIWASIVKLTATSVLGA